MSMIAVIRTGGKQYLVTPGQELKIEKLDVAPGKTVDFDVLLVSDKETKIGGPTVGGVVATATVLAHGRADKVTIVKFHNKVRYLRRKGHRQHWTKVRVEKISA